MDSPWRCWIDPFHSKDDNSGLHLKTITFSPQRWWQWTPLKDTRLTLSLSIADAAILTPQDTFLWRSHFDGPSCIAFKAYSTVHREANPLAALTVAIYIFDSNFSELSVGFLDSNTCSQKNGNDKSQNKWDLWKRKKGKKKDFLLAELVTWAQLLDWCAIQLPELKHADWDNPRLPNQVSL